MNIDTLHKALATLEEAVKQPENSIIRDAVIKRFEYCFELFWKSSMTYLDSIHGISCRSPKSCFRELLSIEIISPEETETLLQMVLDRNTTVHTYQEEMSMVVYKKISGIYLPLMKELAKKIAY